MIILWLFAQVNCIIKWSWVEFLVLTRCKILLPFIFNLKNLFLYIERALALKSSVERSTDERLWNVNISLFLHFQLNQLFRKLNERNTSEMITSAGKQNLSGKAPIFIHFSSCVFFLYHSFSFYFFFSSSLILQRIMMWANWRRACSIIRLK